MHGTALAHAIKPLEPMPYQHRPVRFIELWRPIDGWQLKVYGINVDQNRNSDASVVDKHLLAEAKATIASTLQRPGATGNAAHGIGFMIVHQGILGNWIMLDWWSHEILWNQLLFRSESATAPDIVPVTNGIIACVWEIPLICFERDAWVRLVLQAGQSVSRQEAVSAYLQTRYNGDV